MSSDLHNLNDLLKEIEGISVQTTQGSYVKVEDVRRLMEKKQLGEAVGHVTAFKGKTFNEANQAIKRDLELGSSNSPQLGRSVPASEPQPPSRA